MSTKTTTTTRNTKGKETTKKKKKDNSGEELKRKPRASERDLAASIQGRWEKKRRTETTFESSRVREREREGGECLADWMAGWARPVGVKGTQLLFE